MRVTEISSTGLFTGSVDDPRQVVRVTLANDVPGRIVEGASGTVRLTGPAVTTPEPVAVRGMAAGERRVVEVGVRLAAPVAEGSPRRVGAVVDSVTGRHATEGEIVAAVPGWTMWMVSHFHYDPVWWNTQAGFTETWYDLPAAEERRVPHVKTAFDLVRAHLDAARHDPDYKFVLAEIDYLKPHWDAYPEDRADLRRFLDEGRVELVGGNYNEANTNLTHPESTIRNAVYGIGYQRDVVGGDPRSAWMLDVFGHDPAYPGLMAGAGLDSSAWARGPFHMWGPNRHVGDNRRMQFPSEFEWLSPQGGGLLTAYMANHYGAGWVMDEQAKSLDEAMILAYQQFTELAPVAATRNVLLPVGGDHVVPSRWCTGVHRDWAKRYVWPRFTVGLPRDFFAAVREELGTAAEGGAPRRLSPQTRDMNPVYTGKDVSYIDTKQAQRAAEVAVLDAERLATLAGLVGGARYPSEALDKAWRQLAFGAHHDAITGTESDQVYLDLLGGWREAYELADEVRAAALGHIAARADTSGEGTPVVVANTLSWERDGVTTLRLEFPEPGRAGVALRDDDGNAVPAVTEGVRRHGDGSLAEVTVTFVARAVPALGYRIFHAVEAADLPAGWSGRQVPAGEAVAANQAFRVAADPARGGAPHSIRDLRTGRELLRPGRLGGELTIQEEYPTHPVWQEGPWHLLPRGPGRGTGATTADVRVEESPIGRRIVAATMLDELRITQHVLLLDGLDRVDFRCHVDGSIGHDRLLRARFGLDVPGARPVAETGFAAIGRAFGFPDADAGPTPWTLDCPAHNWAALSSAVRVVLGRAGGGGGPGAGRAVHAIGVAEVVEPDGGRYAGETRELVRALARQGVTATCGRPDGPRYGALDVDSNLPDVRIVLGGPRDNAFAAEVLGAADPAYGDALARYGRVLVPPAKPLAEVWSPDADLRGARDLPALVVARGYDLGSAIADLAVDLDDATVEVTCPAELMAAAQPLTDYSVALLNQGIPGSVTAVDGTLCLNLMRSCSAWPSGAWIDGERRTAPDGSGFGWQHWSHTFGYSLVAGTGDWRRAGFVRAGQEYNHEILARQLEPAAAQPATAEPAAAQPATAEPATAQPATAQPATAQPATAQPATAQPATAQPATAQLATPQRRSEGQAARPADPLPARASLASVSPPDVVLTALKPRGNPLASGRGGDVDPADGIVVRVYESTGRPARARIRLHGGLAEPRAVGVLEEPSPGRAAAGGPATPVEPAGAEVAVELAGTEVATVAARPAGAGEAPAGTGSRRLGAVREPAQPVFTRYWLHNKGPAPLGYLPAAVHVSPARLSLAGAEPAGAEPAGAEPAGAEPAGAEPAGAEPAGTEPAGTEPARLRVTVAASGRPVGGRVELDVPDGMLVGADTPGALPGALPRLEYDLEPGEHACFDLRVAAGTAVPGTAFLAARIRDDLGQVLEDAVAITVGPAGPDRPAGTGGEPLAAPLSVTVEPAGLVLPPGGEGEIVLRLANLARGPVRGEAQLVSPIGTWGPAAGALVTPWTRGFAIYPGSATELRYRVRVPAGARTGAHWWALAKVACFGRLHYTPAIPIEIRPR